MFHFYTPWKHTGGFLMFSGGIEVEHWLEKGRNNYFVNTEMYMSNRKQMCLVENTVFSKFVKTPG